MQNLHDKNEEDIRIIRYKNNSSSGSFSITSQSFEIKFIKKKKFSNANRIGLLYCFIENHQDLVNSSPNEIHR